MKVGFLSDKNGFRAPLHPDSLKKYDKTQLFVDKDIFKNLELNAKDYKKLKPLNKTSLKQMDVVCFVDTVEISDIKGLKQDAAVVGLFNAKAKKEIKKVILKNKGYKLLKYLSDFILFKQATTCFAVNDLIVCEAKF